MIIVRNGHPMISIRDRDRARVELALAPHMMFLMIEQLSKRGWELRIDVLDSLNKACALPFRDLDQLSVRRVARRTDEAARVLLHDLSPDDPREGLLATAVFVLVLVDEGHYADKTSVSVLAALTLMNDAKEHPDDWLYNEPALKEKAKKILLKAQGMSLFP